MPHVQFKSEFQQILDGENLDYPNHKWIEVEGGEVQEVMVSAILTEQSFHMGNITGADAVQQLMGDINNLHAHLINAANAIEFVLDNATMPPALRKHVSMLYEVIATER